ncbi:hypothetical protein MAR_019464 [Mya arenaria]|uniref:Uncharacterized protein n=1 Tax=Mya arenaria TaxID=6604 RepID=A0ABY7E2M9_MYAAR|nr:hypothetical protein MAR_019464 [Mya arenaria]
MNPVYMCFVIIYLDIVFMAIGSDSARKQKNDVCNIAAAAFVVADFVAGYDKVISSLADIFCQAEKESITANKKGEEKRIAKPFNVLLGRGKTVTFKPLSVI